MQLKKDKATLQNFNEAIQHEWLETNGLGGWASSSIIGCNTRRYHGLLVAATKPPAERMNLLSKLDETIIADDNHYEINCNQYNGMLFTRKAINTSKVLRKICFLNGYIK